MASERLFIQTTDPRPGWRLGSRVVPRGYTVGVRRLFRVKEQVGGALKVEDLSQDESDAAWAGAPPPGDWLLGERDWLELDVVSSPTEPPRCVALRAPRGISTPEQRFPIAGVVTEATAAIASKDGTFIDPPHGIDYEDALFEAQRARGRKRPRRAVTPERLAEVAQVAREYPRAPTAAVQRRFGICRGYARKLIKLADRLEDGSA
jgi:hypothetical protein